jgi:hypothetical protein
MDTYETTLITQLNVNNRMKLNEFSDSLIKTVLSYKEGNANEIISKFKYVTNDEQKNKVLAIIYLELLQFLVSRGAPIDIKPLYTPPASGSGPGSTSRPPTSGSIGSGSGSVKEGFQNPHGFGLGFTAIKTTTPPLSEFDDDYYENDNNYYNKPRKYSYQYTDVPTHKNDMVLLPEMAWSVPMKRPPVCTTLGQEPLIQPLYDNSKLLLGTPLNEDTSVGTIMPEFQYKEYVTIPQ